MDLLGKVKGIGIMRHVVNFYTEEMADSPESRSCSVLLSLILRATRKSVMKHVAFDLCGFDERLLLRISL